MASRYPVRVLDSRLKICGMLSTMRLRTHSVALLGLFAGACTTARGDEPFGRLTVAEVAQKRVQPNVFVFDNNAKKRFDKSHVPGARWLDPGEIKAADLPADKSSTLIFYCANEH
jgi:hypothetical protein